jgi:aspartate carbamoyltransferase catalytic subunit
MTTIMRMARLMSSRPPRLLLSVDDISDSDVDDILADARMRLERGKAKVDEQRFSLGLLFWEDSLRTRAGFAEAALRMGGFPVTLLGARNSTAMSAAESFEDTLRVLAGMVDLVVARVPFPLERRTAAACAVAPLVNGGDVGANAEHPSQALIDLFAMAPDGDVSGLRIGVCGDLKSRAARSAIKLIARRRPRELRLMSPAGRAPDATIGLPFATVMQVEDLDVLIMTGLPARRGDSVLNETERAAFALTGKALSSLAPDCIILCPMPAIDEIGEDARRDPRLQMFRQSDHGVAVRSSLLHHMLQA